MNLSDRIKRINLKMWDVKMKKQINIKKEFQYLHSQLLYAPDRNTLR